MMFNRSNFLCYFMLIWALAANLSHAQSVEVRFEADKGPLQGKAILVNGLLSGLVGDVIEIPRGTSYISIALLEAHDLALSLQTDQEGRVSALKGTVTTRQGLGCRKLWKVAWHGADVSNNPDGTAVVRLKNPTMSATDIENCTAASMLPCRKEAAILNVESHPAGAEIWIKDKRMSEKTNSSLSLPLCVSDNQNNERISVLVRMEGKIGCRQVVGVSPGSSIGVTCALKTPKN